MKYPLLHTETGVRSSPRDVLGQNILRVLAYFDIFQYPLRADELEAYLEQPAGEIAIGEKLNELVSEGIVFFHKPFYMLQDNVLLVHRRKMGNQRAEALLRKAFRIGRFLQQFPFVRAVAVSGSLSKNYAGQKDDIDFFIITHANRLWIARTLMHLFKKLCYLTRSQHYYCMNYYLDEEALALEDRNVFTAIELRTILPVSGTETIARFLDDNAWSHRFFPGLHPRPVEDPGNADSWFKKKCETIFRSRFGESIDSWLWKTTSRRWRKKELRGMKNEKGMRMGLLTGKHFAISNPGSFQEKVLKIYEEKLNGLGIGASADAT